MIKTAVFPLLVLLTSVPAIADSPFEGGHVKARLQASGYPNDSVQAVRVDDNIFDQAASGRLKFAGSADSWAFKADYQLIGQFGDSLEFTGDDTAGLLFPSAELNDDRRLMDLSYTFSDNDDRRVQHRLDRMHLDYRSDRWVARLGRQAVSWGNGLLFNPMDFFNPFAPAAVDTEYKTGDDMLYAQYLADNGDDLQAVWVVRRDLDENLDANVNSMALKYHGFVGDAEYDLLFSEHYGDTIVGVGGTLPWGGAVLRADVMLTDTDEDTRWSAVANWSYSWVGFGHNMSGMLEYFYSGYGQDNEEYRPDDILQNTDLAQRLLRGELFTLGKHYLAASVLVEVTPLFQLTPNAFVNLGDGSALLQLVGQYDLAQNWQLLGSVNLPVGGDDTEFGGFDSGIDDLSIETDYSVFAQLAWYF